MSHPPRLAGLTLVTMLAGCIPFFTDGATRIDHDIEAGITAKVMVVGLR